MDWLDRIKKTLSLRSLALAKKPAAWPDYRSRLRTAHYMANSERGLETWSTDDLLAWYPRLGIPHFQRGLVWDKDAVSLLLESLYYETPCGTLILWRPLQLERHGVALPGATSFDHLIIDGQQRIRMLHQVFASNQDNATAGDHSDTCWCFDFAALPQFARDDPGRPANRLFARVVDPLTTKNPRYRANLVPLDVLAAHDEARLRPYLAVMDSTKHDALPVVQAHVRKLRKHRVFFPVILEERAKRYELIEVVRLYNRINSAGSLVGEEEKAYATLVREYEGTPDWLRNVFSDIHKPVGPQLDNRDAFLRRQHERKFGFKLFLRTFVQVCSYEFNRSTRSTLLSFDWLDTSAFLGPLRDTSRPSKVSGLFEDTRAIVSCIHRALVSVLRCDDLRMLPETMSLVPAMQSVIRFPDLRQQEFSTLVGYLILRAQLDPDLTKRDIFELVGVINAQNSSAECISTLRERLAWKERHSARLSARLGESNALLDRYVLLLYWLLRRNHIRDFSYENLRGRRGCSLYERRGYEPVIGEDTEPEKQHIVPSSALSRICGGARRLRSSRNESNNIGNITYISAALNGLGGLGSVWVDPDLDSCENLRAHLIYGPVLDMYRDLRTHSSGLDDSHKELFRNYCAERRKLIQQGFEAWLAELEKALIVPTSYAPKERSFNFTGFDAIPLAQ